MSTTEKYLLGSAATLLSTELDSLANNALALGSAFSNVQGGGGADGYVWCTLELTVTYPVAPTVPSGCSLWLLSTVDGTNYEDGGTSVTPARNYNVVFPLRAVTTAQIISRRVRLPWGSWKPLLKNDGTAQAMNTTGNTLKILPATNQGV